MVSTHLKNITQIGSFPQGSGWPPPSQVWGPKKSWSNRQWHAITHNFAKRRKEIERLEPQNQVHLDSLVGLPTKSDAKEEKKQHLPSQTPTLPKTNIAPEMDGWNTSFLLGNPIFSGYVSFREGTICQLTWLPLHQCASSHLSIQTGRWKKR